jgi:ATP-dependent RNA helicase RhlB
MQFQELNLNPDLQRAIDDLGFERCTDVQAETLQNTLTHRDVTVQSQTGTGKTAAFLITIYQLMNESEQFKGTRALIVAPTRELAVQIENDAKALGKYLPQRTGCFYGGVGYGQQERDLADKVEIVIGTPGRLLDHNQSGRLDFREMGIIVIDEADRLFDMGFYPDIRKMMRRARPRTERLTMLYSATLSVSVRNISWQFMNDPAEIEIEPEHMTVDTVEQELYHVAKDEKFPLLLGILKKESPRNALIFCNTKRATEIVAKKLRMNGYQCEFIIGDLPQKKRLSIIENVKSGDLNMLTATDVAARGLHVDDLDLVVNYDLPEDPEAYVHRIGRTARAGQEGKAVSLACERFVYSLESIEELIGMKIPTARVSDDLLASDESAGKRLPSSHHMDRPPRKRGAGRSSRAGAKPPQAPAGERARAGQSPHHSHSPKHPAADAGADSGDRRKSRRGGRSRGDRERSGSGREHRAAAAASAGGDKRPSGGDKRSSGGDKRPSGGDKRSSGGDKGPSRDDSMNERLEYYRRKYGEDFAPAGGEKTSGSGNKPGSSRRRNEENPRSRSGTAKGGADNAESRDRRSSATPAKAGAKDLYRDRDPGHDHDPAHDKGGLLGRIAGMFRKKKD